jgi:outer membrane protein assembly factor BamB
MRRGMRRHARNRAITVAPAIALTVAVFAACGSGGAVPPKAAPKPPSVLQTDRVLILASYDGAVSVRATTGKVAFRAPFGLAAPDSSTIVQAQPIATGTRVVASDPLTGVPRWSHDIAGTRRVRVVSPGGRYVALVDGDLNVASDARSTTVIDVATRGGTRALRLAGNLDPEAFSVDGRSLYVVDYLPALNPTRYTVRRVDLGTGRIMSVPDRDGSVRTPMPGYSSTQLMSPDGKQLYTFYASAEPIHDDGETYHAWVHVLNLEKGWAHCLDLDEKIALSGSANAGLAVSPDGSRLFVTDGVSQAVVAIDTATLKVVRTRFVDKLASDSPMALDASDGRTLFVPNDVGGISTIDTHSLAVGPVSFSFSGLSGLSALRVDASGAALYVLTREGLLVLDRRGRIVHRWAAPGDATAMDPAVTVPGRGAYRCAC